MIRSLSALRRGRRRAACLATAVFVAFGASATRVLALDPSRRLSQAVHRIWQVQQGLPEATVYSVAQGAEGYLWLGTETGLVRFDGVRFVPIERLGDVAVPKTRVQTLTIDARQTLWIGTSDFGLLHVDGDRTRHYGLGDGLPSNDIRCAVPGADRVWLCTAHGLAEVASSGITARGIPTGWGGPDVQAACVAPDGGVWIGGDGPLVAMWNGRAFLTRPLTSVGRLTNVHALYCDRSGDVWVGTSAGLIRMASTAGAVERRMTIADGLAADDVLSLSGTRDGSLLVGTTNGFSRLRHGAIDSFGPSDGLSQSSVYALFEDREGSVWVATKHGLNQFLDGRAVPYTTAEGLPSNDTGPIVQDARGRIWIGTIGSGLGFFDGSHVSAVTAHNGLLSDVILSLAVGADGDLWVGTDRGLDRLRDGRVISAWTIARGLPGNRVEALVADREGAVWIATPQGLARLPPQAPVPVAVTPVLASPAVAIGVDRAGTIFAALENGALVAVGDGRPANALPAEVTLRRVDALFQDDQGAVWIGTLGDGLRLLDHGRLSTFHTADGLFDDTIYGIVADDHGRLWMACSKGIFSVDRADLLRFAAGGSRSFASTPYSPTDALRTIECKSGVQPAVWRMRDGSIWFSTIRGVLTLDPAHLERRLASPPAMIEDVTVDGATTAPAALAALPARARNVEFRYTGLSLVVPTRLTFRYRLEGFDEDWIDAGTRRQAFYTNLPPRHFRFLVRACLPDGTCSDAPSAVALSIAPRLDERPWFAPLVVLAIGGAAWGLYRQRIRRLRANFALVLAERARIARELHDTLIQGFSGIAMALKAVTDRLPPSAERRTLESVVSDTADCLRDARRTLAGLRRSDLDLAPAVEQAARQLTQGTALSLRLHIDPCVCAMPASTEYQLARIAHEAIVNAVKHAAAQSLEVSLESTPRRVRLRVADDGRGFDAASAPPGHYGLVGMRERAAEIGAALEFTGGPGRGTAVSVVWTSET
jgi:signal transduction histidine kinase/ligand-binding sensor domain-containing protein